LNIVVCVKQTPDTAATVTVQDGKVSWGDAALVINPWDEYAVETALRLKEAQGGKVTALSMGPEAAREAIKHALAMGCDEALLVSDPAITAPDSLAASAVLAAAVKKLGEVDLLFFGRQAVDSDTGLTAAQVARRLGWPALTLVAAMGAVDPSARTVVVERMLDEGRQEIKAPMPAVISVVKEICEPRYPSFMGIRKASKTPIPVWSLADIGLEAAPASALAWPEVFAPPKVETKCEMIEGDSAQAKAAKLAERLIEEKVI
jgi:electron transfer flavoprotein beta subunit